MRRTYRLRIKSYLVLGILLLITGSRHLYGRTKTSPHHETKIMDINLINGNELNMYISNYGVFGHSPQGNAGAWWPSNRRLETYIFGAGPWIGAITKDGDTVVTWFYNPNSGESEGVPAHIADPNDLYNYNAALSDPYDRVHIYGITTNEGYEWPLKTVTGEDSVVSDMDSYEAFLDIDPAHQESDSKPLGLYVVEQTYQWDVPGLDNTVFNIYEIENISGDTLYNVYAGITYDNDIGNESGSNANDLVGFIRSYDFPDDTLGPIQLNLAYQYQITPEAGWIGMDGNGTPGVIGCVFLESPLATDTVVVWDTIGTTVGPDTVLPGQPLGMTAFKIFTVSIDPTNDPARYSLMAGFDPPEAGGAYNPYMDDIFGPGDKRFIQVSGPFTMAPNEKVRLVSAIVIGRDTMDILEQARKALLVYKNNFTAVPQSPEPSPLYVNSRDNKVYLWWDNTSELSVDSFYYVVHNTNPAYRLHDFEGYMLLKSIDMIKWDTLAIYDLKDGVTTIYTDSLYDPYLNWWVYTDSIVLGHDSGIKHYYIDSTDLEPGIVYHYKLIPFDFNYGNYQVVDSDTVGISVFTLQGKPSLASVVVVGNQGQAKCEPNIEKHGLENIFNFNGVMAFSPDTSITLDTFKLVFYYKGVSDSTFSSLSPAFPLISMKILNKNNDILYTVPDTSIIWTLQSSNAASGSYTYTADLSIDINGWSFLDPHLVWNINLNQSYYSIPRELYAFTTSDSSTWKITRVSTEWSPNEDTTYWNSIVSNPAGFVTPAVYKIEWVYNSSGDSITLQVYDTIRKVYVPYNPEITRVNSPYGWAFIQGVNGSPRFGATEWISANTSANITGIYAIKLPGSKPMELTDFGGTAPPPPNGSVWYIKTYVPDGNVSTLPITGEYYTITFNTSYQTLPSTKTMDLFGITNNNKVILKLPNLPHDGMISLYDLNGRLIRRLSIQQYENNEILLNKNQLPSGIFYYNVTDKQNKIWARGKVIIIK